ncbi:TPA: CD1845 family protein [Neisseria gonorrhoeae]
MRWTIKIIFFPISFLLSILTAFLTFLLGIGTALLYLLMMFCIFGAIASFLQKEVTIGIEALIIGFLVSPYGVPIGITRRITIGAICSAHSFFKH